MDSTFKLIFGGILIAILSTPLPTKATEREPLAAHGADLATTAVGLHLGAAEANPLGPVLVLAKTAAWAYGRHLPTTSSTTTPIHHPSTIPPPARHNLSKEKAK